MNTASLARLLPGLLLTCVPQFASADTAVPVASLTTLAEQSGYRQTGRYPEVERLCQAYQQAWPDAVRCFEFGRTPEGRPMLALSVSRSGALTPEVARQRGIPVFLMQGGIHAGEIDGKDAGFLTLREMLQDKAAAGVLEKEVIVFVPVYNVDGHERFGHWNRPNQVGPEEMGWRTTAQNYNLNRDYAKADAPETQAMLGLLNQWDPILYADMHVTDGANFQHDISLTVEPLYAGDSGMRDAAAGLRKETIRQIAANGAQPLDFYPSFEREDDPASGFAVQVVPPRFSTGYWGLRNRLAMLVETHAWKDYATRVRITHDTILSLAQQTAARGPSWLRTAHRADERAARLGGEQVALNFDSGEHVGMIDFKGYAYTREPSAISGGLVTRYDTAKPQVWHIPLKDTVKPILEVRAPEGGYIVPAAWAALVGQKLALHGIEFRRLDAPPGKLALEAFRASDASFSKPSFEGHSAPILKGEWKGETREVPAGSLYVPLAQPKARLVMALLEPLAPDSLCAWGFFNTAFEQKEYMEPYVAEQVAEQMLAKDPALAAEFRSRLAGDEAFAHDPQARLDFFYRRSPSWDERLDLYPVYRVQKEP